MQRKKIRNFSIIAHIDHGKSTLADRLLELTGAVTEREMKSQLLDDMDLEREKGITIKLNAVQLKYKYCDQEYFFHLIDTPGHVDFTYEVSRSLAACEGAVLVIDAVQGIEAQTLANLYLALYNDLTIIPVINKIDLPNANIEKTKKEIIDVLGFKEEEIILISAKTGEGVERLLEAIIERIPAPKGNEDAPLQALIFDSFYDLYRGIVVLVRIVNGHFKIGDKIKFMNTGAQHEIVELGVNIPKEYKKDKLIVGEVGYLSASIKNIDDVKVGDTITLVNNPAKEALPGYKTMKSMVFCGLYPIDSSKYNELREALSKLQLNDDSLHFEPESSKALGLGFRGGFLGLLHMEITLERVKREFNIDLIVTSPNVVYQVILTDGKEILIENPTKLPDRQKIKEIKEPYIRTNILVPNNYIGSVMELCQEKRGQFINMEYIDETRVNIHYEIPLSEIIYDFYDRLKSYTKGYASFDYEIIGYKVSDLIRMDILVNGVIVDALSVIVHKDFARARGKVITENLKEVIPRQQFEIPIQAVIDSKVIARTDIKALRKNVLAKCYGGDVTRKRKLLEKQKEGKKRMKKIGNIEIPQEAFLSVLKVNK